MHGAAAEGWIKGSSQLRGREPMVKLIESLSAGVPRPLVEIAKLGRTLSMPSR